MSTQESGFSEEGKAADPAALTVALHGARPRLIRWIASKTPRGCKVDAEDVVQDAMVSAFRHITEFQSQGPDSFYHWLQTIVENQLHDALRATSRKKRGGDHRIRSFDQDTVVALLEIIASPLKTPGTRAARTEAIKVVLANLETLPDDQRRAVWLLHGEGMSIAVAAVAMGKTEPAFRGLCARGLKKLRAAIRDSGVLTRT